MPATDEPKKKKPRGPVKATGGPKVGESQQTRASAAARAESVPSSALSDQPAQAPTASTAEGAVPSDRPTRTPTASTVAAPEAARAPEAQLGVSQGPTPAAGTSSGLPRPGIKARRRSTK